MNNKIIPLILALFLIFPVISASGLDITTEKDMNIEKQFQQDKNITFTLKNNYNKTLYNVSFEQNDYIEMPEIKNMTSNESKNVTATITTNDNVDETIRIKGVYYTDLGIQDETHEVTVDFNDGLSECDMTVVEQDTVKWNNDVSDTIKIISDYGFESGEDTIDEGESAKINFNNPGEEFTYYFERRGFTFTDTCTINVIPSEGYVNDQKLDAQLNLNVNVNYPPTNISVDGITKTNYTIKPFNSDGGAISITNTGDKKARNIHLEGEWMSFSENDFDLESGSTKGISYTISPQITETEQTNQTYFKDMNITGNFETKTTNFMITVPYMEITDEGSFKEGKSIIEMIEEWCEENPEKCTGGTEYVVGNGSGQKFNVTHSRQQVNEMYGMMFDVMDRMKKQNSELRQEVKNLEESLNQTEQDVKDTKQHVSSIAESSQNTENSITSLIIVILAIIIVYILYQLIKQTKKGNQFNRYVGSILKNNN